MSEKSGMVIHNDSAGALVQGIRMKQRRIVCTADTFLDVLQGDVKFFVNAKEKGDVLLMCINSKNFNSKGGNSAKKIAFSKIVELLLIVGIIDYVILYKRNKELSKFLKDLRPDILIKAKENNNTSGSIQQSLGGDHRFRSLFSDLISV